MAGRPKHYGVAFTLATKGVRSGIDLPQIGLDLGESYSDIAHSHDRAQQQPSNLSCRPAEQIEHR
jgi:hypothetical protein